MCDEYRRNLERIAATGDLDAVQKSLYEQARAGKMSREEAEKRFRFFSEPVIRRSELHLVSDGDGGYICREMLDVSRRFIEIHKDSDEIEEAINSRLAEFRTHVRKRNSGDRDPAECGIVPTDETAEEVFDRVIAEIDSEVRKKSVFERFLYWVGTDWWYGHPLLEKHVYFEREDYLYDQHLITKYLVSLLPEKVRSVVEGDRLSTVAVHGEYFAILFVSEGRGVRRIVTNSQLFELRGVEGYRYLDITPEGKPIARCVCDRGGGRAFFDGVHLMSHDTFQTCAPSVAMITGGYKVNSTRSTIINGMLFELIDVDDKVAQTTGVDWPFGCDFSTKDAIEAQEMSRQSATRVVASGRSVFLDGNKLIPVGVFAPSHRSLLDSGFTLCEWSEFNEVDAVRYESVLVVDDTSGWLDKVSIAFSEEVSKLDLFETSDKRAALDRILEVAPEALLLDMHLTEDEEFDGLWIANQLVKRKFKGVVHITSGYPVEDLRKMAALIKGPVHTPGKDIDRIRTCLFRRCSRAEAGCRNGRRG